MTDENFDCEEIDIDAESEIDSETIEDKIAEEDIQPARKLDYTIQSPAERNKLVSKIVAETPVEELTPKYLEILADYIIFAMDKEERKQKKILTSNRLVTVNKRETSFEGLCSSFENGEDGIYNILSDLGKNTILTPKDPITAEDVEKLPDLQRLKEAIAAVEEQYKAARGKRKYLLKKQIIEMQQDQYVIRNDARGKWLGSKPSHLVKSFAKLKLFDKFSIAADGEPINEGVVNFFNHKHIEALLCNYSGLKQVAAGAFRDDLYYLMEDLDGLSERALADYPVYQRIVLYKIDGKQNVEIQQLLEEEFGQTHSIEYLSSLWRNKIPKLIAEKAKEEYLLWHYTMKEKGTWKKCSKCGQIKLAHNKFFSKNKTSKDGYYSICKCCRNAKNKKK